MLNVSCCLISCKHHRIVVASVYRSPSVRCVDVISELQSIFLQLSSCAQHVILAGDFNIDLLSSSNMKSQYCDILTDFHVTQHILEPSRVCNLSSTLIAVADTGGLQWFQLKPPLKECTPLIRYHEEQKSP